MIVRMNKLTISSFGPIKDVELEMKDLCAFIGPQASGKSTIAKLLYFFLFIKEDLIQFAAEAMTANVSKNAPSFNLIDIKKRLRMRFVQLFGTTKHMKKFKVSFIYKDAYEIELSLKEGYVQVKFSSSFEKDLVLIIERVNEHISSKSVAGIHFVSPDEAVLIQAANRKFVQEIRQRLNDLAGTDDSSVIYVPASRSLLATLSDYIYRLMSDSYGMLPDSTLDYSVKTFIERITQLKKMFSQSIDEIIRDKKKFSETGIEINTEGLDHVKYLITKILRGEYRYDRDEERLYYSDTEYVKLSLSSSGQQEAVWILQLIFSLMLNNTRATLVIEEPEAHLFPEAQMYMVWLMALFANQKGNRLIVTTHSPYILTSLNNLLYAEQVSKVADRQSVEKIIPSPYWLDFDRLSVNLIGEGEISSILDRSIKQIKAEMIDSVSGILNEQYEQLLDLDTMEEEA